MGDLCSCLRGSNETATELVNVNKVSEELTKVYADPDRCAKSLNLNKNRIQCKNKNKGGSVLANTPIHQDSCYWEVIIRNIGDTQGDENDEWIQLSKKKSNKKEKKIIMEEKNEVKNVLNEEWTASFGNENDEENNDNQDQNKDEISENNDESNESKENSNESKENSNNKTENMKEKNKNQLLFGVGVCKERKGKSLYKILGGEEEESKEYPGSWALLSNVDDIKFRNGDVIGCCFRASDLPMLTFTLNGEMINSKHNKKRIRGTVWPAVYTNDKNVVLEFFFKEDEWQYEPIYPRCEQLILTRDML